MTKLNLYTSKLGTMIPDKETFDALEEAIRWAEIDTPDALRFFMDKLCLHMAVLNQGEARKLSAGPLDPGMKNPNFAWRLPVRRISGDYLAGWKVKRKGKAFYILYNASREAYFIEYGINWLGEGRRVRRPVRKLSLRRTMERMMTTHAFHRVWCDMYSSPKYRHRGRGFYQIVQSPAKGHTRWENISVHEAKGVIRRAAFRGETTTPRMRNVGGQLQIRRGNRGGGSYGGPRLGRRLP